MPPAKTAAEAAALEMNSGLDDFEDALQYFSAVRFRSQCFVTRNPNDFPKGPLTVVSPVELLALIETRQD